MAAEESVSLGGRVRGCVESADPTGAVCTAPTGRELFVWASWDTSWIWAEELLNSASVILICSAMKVHSGSVNSPSRAEYFR